MEHVDRYNDYNKVYVTNCYISKILFCLISGLLHSITHHHE
jgi:hypothetical protein